MNIEVGKPCHGMQRWAQGRTSALRKQGCPYLVCYVKEAEAPPWGVQYYNEVKVVAGHSRSHPMVHLCRRK